MVDGVMYVVIFILLIIFVLALARPMQIAYETIRGRQIDYENRIDERINYMQNVLGRRRYVPLSSLPNIDFGATLETISEGEIRCLSVPAFVSRFNTPNFDCTEMCDDPSATYFYVGPFDRFVVNGEMLTSGGYCTTNSVPRQCNRETSVIVHGLNQWTCIAEDPRYFAGEQNMVQTAGRQHVDSIRPDQIDRIVLFDRQLGMPVDVSRNTFRSHWDETLSDGSRRFEVRCDARDINNNSMFINPLNPIECLPNVCTNVQYVHPAVRPDFERGVCDCGDPDVTRVVHVDPNDPSSMCASIVHNLNQKELTYEFRIDCINMNTPVSRIRTNMLLCPEHLMESTGDAAYTFVMPGAFPMSTNGIEEPNYRLWLDVRNRVNFFQRRHDTITSEAALAIAKFKIPNKKSDKFESNAADFSYRQNNI